MKFEYAIQILKEEISRLNDKEPMTWTFKEFKKIDEVVDELKEVIKMLERGSVYDKDMIVKILEGRTMFLGATVDDDTVTVHFDENYLDDIAQQIVDNLPVLRRKKIEEILMTTFGYRYELKTIRDRDIEKGITKICSLVPISNVDKEVK